MRKLILRTLVAMVMLAGLPLAASADVNLGVAIGNAPPPLPYYDQPTLPGDGYLWMPGYWAWDSDVDDYFWVPGTWVLPPEPGYLWTPGYWGWSNDYYRWNPGYWGPHVGFYGGVNYGYGYTGSGYHGGYWRDRRFHYNRAVNNVRVVNVRQVNVYNETVVNNVSVNRVSYNGGNGGLRARPNFEEERAQRDRHTAATQIQTQHERAAVKNRELRASVNRGKPAIAATERPNQFSGKGVVAAREAGGPVKAEERDARGEVAPATAAERARRAADTPRRDGDAVARTPYETPSVSRPERPARAERAAREAAASSEQNRAVEERKERAIERRAQTPPRDMQEREVQPPPLPQAPSPRAIPEQRRAPEVDRPGNAREAREIRQERREQVPEQRPDSGASPGERPAKPRKPDDAQPPR